MATDEVDLRRADERFHTDLGWLDSWHSFSFSSHFDPDNTHHGLLLVNNDDRVAPGGGFPPHAHRDMEIVTWVLDGRLEHGDTLGNRDVIYPGLAQRMSAGRGIQHSEMNASQSEPVHFVQMWVPPDTSGLDASYEQRDVAAQLAAGELFPIASGSGRDGSVRINQRGAELWGGRLEPGGEGTVGESPHAHVFVARGSVALEPDVDLDEGDAARLTGGGSRRITAGDGGAEVLIWLTD